LPASAANADANPLAVQTALLADDNMLGFSIGVYDDAARQWRWFADTDVGRAGVFLSTDAARGRPGPRAGAGSGWRGALSALWAARYPDPDAEGLVPLARLAAARAPEHADETPTGDATPAADNAAGVTASRPAAPAEAAPTAALTVAASPEVSVAVRVLFWPVDEEKPAALSGSNPADAAAAAAATDDADGDASGSDDDAGHAGERRSQSAGGSLLGTRGGLAGAGVAAGAVGAVRGEGAEDPAAALGSPASLMREALKDDPECTVM
jgi:hypothetical protein